MLKFDEMYTMLPTEGSDVRAHYRRYGQWLSRQSTEAMQARRTQAEMIFRRVGITFAVYGAKDEDGAGTERLIPFDLIPRIIPGHEWRRMQQGLVQRVTALNRFIHDVYHGQSIIRAGIVPADLIVGNAQYRPEMEGLDVPRDVYAHIAGIDIVRAPGEGGEGIYYVLEDNLRVPSGVSYMLENRKMMMRLFPELFSMHRVAPVAHYPDLLLDTLRASAPTSSADPTVVVLTPGMYNSAYFEHAFLAQQMGVELVEGQDLARPAAGGRDLPPRGRRLPRPAGVPPHLHAGLRGPHAGLSRGQCRHLQRRGHGHRGRQVRLPLRARDDPLLPRRRAHPAERAHLDVPPARRPEIRARPPR
jgi:uncharacterized circularly permuted ATP-grasp superfamily protein